MTFALTRTHSLYVSLAVLSLLAVLVVLGFTPTRTDAQDGGEQSIGLTMAANGFVAPVDLDSPPDDSGRLFVVDQVGVIYMIDANGEAQPFLDIRDRLVDLDEGYDERGLLGLAFHPDFANNGRFFVYYSAPLRDEAPDDWNHTSHLSEFTASGDNMSQADPNSERILLMVDQPQMNHDGGDIAFGPDGFLYIPLGDGGGADDTGTGHTEDLGNGQDYTNLLGSILRIDVDNGDPYGIPADNPFVDNSDVPDETYAFGFRNPWRISFSDDGRLFVADAGQELYEEVSIVAAGENHGWNIMEGTHCFDPESPENPPAECATTGPLGQELIDPVIEFGHDLGNVVVGGDTYTGSVAELDGMYVFGTWSTNFDDPNGELFAAMPSDMDGELWPFNRLQIANNEDGRLGLFVLAIEKGGSGETYVLTSQTPGPSGETGAVWQIVPADQAGQMTISEPSAETGEMAGEETTGDMEEHEGAATAGDQPSLTVNSQEISNEGNVTIEHVVAPGPAWVVIHADDSGNPGQVIGWAAVSAGESTNVIVPIQGDMVTETLHAMLHSDLGEEGTYEFPGADVPVMDAAGNVVNVPFQVGEGQD